MTEKVKIKLTVEQEKALKSMLSVSDAETILERHAEKKVKGGWYCSEFAALNGFSQMDLARALLIGYEFESDYKVGDWVKFWKNDCLKTVGEIISKTPTEVSIQLDDTHFHLTKPDNIIRHATPEEIKTEQERRQWKKIGREPGDFEEADVGLIKQGHLVFGRNTLLIKYERKELEGFFPAESFIEFGGVDDE